MPLGWTITFGALATILGVVELAAIIFLGYEAFKGGSQCCRKREDAQLLIPE
jgi:hypothetical protein